VTALFDGLCAATLGLGAICLTIGWIGIAAHRHRHR
jgi:hypothetical protein